MDFRTQVELPSGNVEIKHSDKLLLLGSCFAENMGNWMKQYKFRCDVNPFGILYNPFSIAEALQQLQEKRLYKEDDLFFAHGLWHSFMHHSSFSDQTVEETLRRINGRIAQADITQTDWLVMTWGTAWVYTLKKDGRVVGNCHKLPEKTFQRRLLGVEEVVDRWLPIIQQLRQENPSLKLLFTVSPIRHVRDGMHENQLSKATLLLAIHRLCDLCKDCYYFPSYEIVMDELRDYRFYAEDMIHPSPVAVSYLWECLCKTYFGEATLQIMKEWDEIKKGLEHRPFDAQSEAYRTFLMKIVLKINRIKEKFPYFELEKELELCQTRLKI